MAGLPQILAGPIVRRVADNSVSVWIAVRDHADIQLAVWEGSQKSTGPLTVDGNATELGRTTAPTRTIGAHLHVAVVTVSAAATPLNPGTVYSYDLTVGGQGLRDLGLLRDETAGNRLDNVKADAPLHLALGYATDMLPTFVTPAATLENLRLAHTSCRRTNASGPDALAYLDDLILANRGDPQKRPQQLFLTGDQIYADDLAASLLPQLNEIGQELLGFAETLPIDNHPVAVDLVQFPAMRRKRVVREIGRFTTTDGQNHLLSYGEYLAMYLLVWSPRMWRPLGTASELFIASPKVEANHLHDWEKVHGDLATWKKKAQPTFDEDVADVAVFRAAVPRVARALANCATYMMFDDHEVTDDWYLSESWRSRVLTAPFGHDVLQNGYLAFTVMQMWGNDPAAFTHTAGSAPKNETLLDAIEAIGKATTLTPANRATLDPLLGMSEPVKDPEASFHYQVPGPRHLVRVLDTRTRRRYKGRLGPPKLLGDSLDPQLPSGPLTDGRELLVVVSPVPVLGARLFDTFVQPLGALTTDLFANAKAKAQSDDGGPPNTGAEDLDVEGWGADEQILESMIQRLATYPKAVVLSGDVHFSSSVALDFWNAQATTLTARVVQLTCSPCRNGWPADMRAILRSGRFSQQLIGGLPFERLAWKEKAPITIPDGTAVAPGRRSRMRRAPSLLPAAGWPSGVAVPADKPPDWRWRLAMVRDLRGRAEIPGEPPPRLPAFDSANAADSYLEIALKHAELSLGDTEPLRTTVFASAIGIVTVEQAGSDQRVVHELLSAESPSSLTGAARTRHRASLSADPAVARPQLQVVPGG